MDEDYKPLIAFIIAIWSAILVLIVAMIINIKSQKIESYEPTEIIPSCYEEPQDIVEPKLSVLEQSILLCKNEYSTRIAHAVIKEHERQGVPIPIIYALIGTESDKTRTNQVTLECSGYFTPYAESSASCRGLTQVSYETFCDFNTFNKFGHQYTWDDMYDIDKNIEVGVWHYTRYIRFVGEDWINLYIIYNAGYGNYSRSNNYWIYNEYTEKWENHNASWYYRNHKYPPTKSDTSFEELTNFSPTRRFEIYLNMYTELFA
jgi:hypothetical protein